MGTPPPPSVGDRPIHQATLEAPTKRPFQAHFRRISTLSTLTATSWTFPLISGAPLGSPRDAECEDVMKNESLPLLSTLPPPVNKRRPPLSLTRFFLGSYSRHSVVLPAGPRSARRSCACCWPRRYTAPPSLTSSPPPLLFFFRAAERETELRLLLATHRGVLDDHKVRWRDDVMKIVR